MTDPDRMTLLGTLPDLDFSTGTVTRVGRPAYRDYDTLILPAVQLDLAGIAEARALLDQAERDILAYRYRLFAADGDWTGWDIDIRRCAQWLDVLGISFEGDDTDPVISADWPRAAGCLRHAAELGGGGFEELRALVDLLCSDKTPADAAEDLPDACGWQGGEGDGGEFCEGCRDDQAAKLAAGTENGQ